MIVGSIDVEDTDLQDILVVAGICDCGGMMAWMG